MKNQFRKYFHSLLRLFHQHNDFLDAMKEQNSSNRLLIGRMLANQVKQHGIYENINDAEFQVYSQFGDDGILQYLIKQTNPSQHTFIEFGVQDYTEANTRFLLLNNNWRGLILDCDSHTMLELRKDELYWRHDLTAVSSFVTRENINSLFLENGFVGEIGLLSIDIDGNDYWIWEAINSVTPIIVIVEYNSVFGDTHAITIPYDPDFYRTKAHYSNLFWGASLKAFGILADKKGYAFVGCNSHGNNAYFVRKDKVAEIPVKSIEEGYVESHFRESRDIDGKLTFRSGLQRIETIKELQVMDLKTNSLIYLRDLFT